ncbi:MAG: hypothetical protein ACRDTM_16330 [Micromonosporaceae bacterium]
MKRLVFLFHLAVALLAALAFAAPAQAAVGSSTSAVQLFSDGSAVPGASSTLTRTGRGVSVSLRTSGLTAGDAVTVWWVVFNHPEECQGMAGSPYRCGEPDLFNPDVEASVQYAGGHIIGGSGSYSIGSYLSEGDTTGCALGDELLCAGLIDAQVADVHFVVRTHGEALPEYLPGQFQSFGGACGNVPEEFGGGGPNMCEDLQFSVHETS